jgi:hypothetical protein
MRPDKENPMKKIVFLFAVLWFSAASVQAQDAGNSETPYAFSRFSLGADLSYWNVQALDDFDIDGAFGGGVIGQFRLQDHLALEMRLSGFAAGDTEDVLVPGEGWYENELTLVSMPMEVDLIGFLPLGDTFSLYGGPGIGYYFFDGEFRSTQGPVEITRDIDLDNEVGFYALCGARAQLARNMALFAEGKYTWVETTVRHGAGVFQAQQDIDFSGLALQAGMIFTF